MTNLENTENQPAPNSEPEKPPDWLTATAEDFNVVDLNGPITGVQTIDCSEISDLYRKKANEAAEAGRGSEHRVYAMISALCSFHFKPNERHEPFGPLMRMEGRRSPIPDDFRGGPEKLLAARAQEFANPALKARVNDTLWLLDRSRAQAAQAAQSGYIDIVLAVRDGKADFRVKDYGADSHLCEQQLRRALQIARTVGWDKEDSLKARGLVNELRQHDSRTARVTQFSRFAELDLDFGVSEPKIVAAEAEVLVAKSADHHVQHHLWLIAAKGYADAEAEGDKNRCRAEAAECLVSESKRSGSAMAEAHWLERAITELFRVPGSQERRRELKHRLIDIQAKIPDELSSFSHPWDLSDIASAAQEAVRGRPFMSALRQLVQISFPPSPEQLRKDAEASIEKHPLQGILAGVVMDADGKPVHRYSGAEDDEENGAIQQQIMQAEMIRRTVLAQGTIEPARRLIMAEHYVTQQELEIVCHFSPFVPMGHEGVYMNGFARFFQGDMIGALHVLVPQLENSIRHILRNNGHDVTKLNNDMTQEDMNLSVMLERLKNEMVSIFGAPLVTDIDNVFNYRGGPSIRHQVAHGRISEGAPFSPHSIYACWFILQLCCIPIFPQWKELEKRQAMLLGESVVEKSS